MNTFRVCFIALFHRFFWYSCFLPFESNFSIIYKGLNLFPIFFFVTHAPISNHTNSSTCAHTHNTSTFHTNMFVLFWIKETHIVLCMRIIPKLSPCKNTGNLSQRKVFCTFLLLYGFTASGHLVQ